MRRTPREVRNGKVPLGQRMRPDEPRTEDRQDVPEAAAGRVLPQFLNRYLAGNHGKNAFVFAM